MTKSPDAFRTISEVAQWLAVPAHVLRFWESRFTQIRPVKRAGGRRYYRPADMELLGGIKRLLHDDGLTIRGVQKILREEGVRHVSALSPALEQEETSGSTRNEGAPDGVRDNVVPLAPISVVVKVPAAAEPEATHRRGPDAQGDLDLDQAVTPTYVGHQAHTADPPQARVSVLATLLAITARPSRARAEHLRTILDRARSLARTMDARR